MKKWGGVRIIVRNCTRMGPIIHAKEFFVFVLRNEPLKGFKTGREVMRYATLKLANWIIT